jgi:cobalt-zinc-cadmium efflux system membrane fusion protein
MRLLVALLAVSLTLGCAKREEKVASGPNEKAPDGEPDAHGPDEADEENAAKDAGIVRIAPTMLRDLQVTTAAVETRPGSESAPVVAELRVADQGYAEVSSPVAARAMQVPVTAGQEVKRGQILAELQSLDLGRARGEYHHALARVELARQAVERKRGLAQERIAPIREVQEAEAELRSAEAGVGSARPCPGRRSARACCSWAAWWRSARARFPSGSKLRTRTACSDPGCRRLYGCLSVKAHRS